VSSSRRDVVIALAVATLSVLAQLPIFDRTLSMMDEGHILQYADIVARGGELYRDANLLPLPGGFYFLATAFELFGPSIRVARWLVVIEFALLCAMAFLLMRRLVPRSWALGSVLMLWIYKIWAFPHWHMYSYSTLSLTLLAAATLLVVRFTEREERAALGIAGLCVGLATFCKQDYGAAGFLALGLTLVVFVRTATSTRDGPLAIAGVFIIPGALVGIATALHFLIQGLFLEMLQQTVLNHLVGIASFEYSSLPPLLPLFERVEMFRSPYGFGTYAPSILFTVDWETIRQSAFYSKTFLWGLAIKLYFYLPYLLIAAALVRQIRVRGALRDAAARPRALAELALTTLAVALILALNKPVDYVHMGVLYWPLLLLVLAWIHRALGDSRRRRVVLAVVTLLPALLLVGYTARLAWLLRDLHDTPLRGERAGVYVKANDERVIGSAADFVRENTEPGERVAVLPYFPLISFLAERDSPHPAIYTFWPIEYIEDRETKIARAIDESGADLLLYHFTQFVQFPRMSEYAPQLFGHLVDHYEMDRVFSDESWGYMLAALRREEPREGQRLVEEGASSLRVFIEAKNRSRRELHGADRDALLRTERWPFRPVFALRPLAGGRRPVASLALTPPPGSRLETAVGVHPTHWFRFPPSDVAFEIHIVEGDERREVASVRVDPQRDRSQRRWFDIDLDLSAWADRPIDVEFSVRTSSPGGEVLEMGGFEIPRLVTAPAGLD
jgi:hypothetical protein